MNGISAGETIVLVVMLTTIAFVMRGLFILFLPELPLPHVLQRALRYVPPAVFAALVAPELLLENGGLTLHPGNEKLVAGMVAGVIAWRTRNTLATVLAGMAILHALRYLGA